MSDLAGDGKEIRIPLVTQLIGSGVGVGTLVGNEETLDSYGMPMWADWARNAVANNRAANKENSFSVQSTAQSCSAAGRVASSATISWTRCCRSRPRRSRPTASPRRATGSTA
jgi:hypothetical protein